MKQCTTYTIEWNEQEDNYIKFPDKCLSCTVVNYGDSQVVVDQSAVLNPNKAYPLEHHVGYYYTGRIELRLTNTNPPFGAKTKVLLRMVVEV